MSDTKAARHKVQLDLSPGDFDRLNRLKDRLDGSYSDAVSKALRLLEEVSPVDGVVDLTVQDPSGVQRFLKIIL